MAQPETLFFLLLLLSLLLCVCRRRAEPGSMIYELSGGATLTKITLKKVDSRLFAAGRQERRAFRGVSGDAEVNLEM